MYVVFDGQFVIFLFPFEGHARLTRQGHAGEEQISAVGTAPVLFTVVLPEAETNSKAPQTFGWVNELV